MIRGLEPELGLAAREAQERFDVAFRVEEVEIGACPIPMLGRAPAEQQPRDHRGLLAAIAVGLELRTDLEDLEALTLMAEVEPRAIDQAGPQRSPQHGEIARNRIFERDGLAAWAHGRGE